VSITKTLFGAVRSVASTCALAAGARERGFIGVGMAEGECCSESASRTMKPLS